MFKINDFEIHNLEDFKKVIEETPLIINEFKYKHQISKTRIRTYNIYMYVCMHGTPEMLKYLKTNFTNIKDFKDEKNDDSYLIASFHGYLEIMKYLEKEHNWDIHVKNNNGDDAYLLASLNGQLEIMKYLEKEHNWDIHLKNNYGIDAYLATSCYGQLEIMKYLEKEHNWDIHIKNNNGYDAYFLAAYRGHLKIMKYLDEIHNWKFHDYSFESTNAKISKYLDKIKFKKNMKRIKKISNNECIICLEDFNKNDDICKCTNGHNIHLKCYLKMDNKIKCCLCNQNNMIKEYIFTYE